MGSEVLRFPLEPPPMHPYTGTGGPAERARGEFRLRIWPDGTGAGLTRAEHLRLVNNEGGFYQTWLVADLRVPRRLDAEDLERLPRATPDANRPGSIFTLDGKAPRPFSPSPDDPPNTVWVAVRAGAWGTDELGRQPGARWYLNDFSNWSFWLLEGWGLPAPAVAEEPLHPRDPDAPHLGAVRGLPSQVALRILADLYLHRATVLPELGPEPSLARMQAVWNRHVPPLDRNGDGLLGYGDVVGQQDHFLDPIAFERVIVTREVPSVSTAPRFYPTTAAVVLAGWREDLVGAQETSGEQDHEERDGGDAEGDSVPLTETATDR